MKSEKDMDFETGRKSGADSKSVSTKSRPTAKSEVANQGAAKQGAPKASAHKDTFRSIDGGSQRIVKRPDSEEERIPENAGENTGLDEEGIDHGIERMKQGQSGHSRAEHAYAGKTLVRDDREIGLGTEEINRRPEAAHGADPSENKQGIANRSAKEENQRQAKVIPFRAGNAGQESADDLSAKQETAAASKKRKDA